MVPACVGGVVLKSTKPYLSRTKVFNQGVSSVVYSSQNNTVQKQYSSQNNIFHYLNDKRNSAFRANSSPEVTGLRPEVTSQL